MGHIPDPFDPPALGVERVGVAGSGCELLVALGADLDDLGLQLLGVQRIALRGQPVQRLRLDLRTGLVRHRLLVAIGRWRPAFHAHQRPRCW